MTLMQATTATITIRHCHADDAAVIRRLAALDSAAIPPAPFVLAEVEGEPRAALSLTSGRAIADPFYPTLHIVAMLRAYAADATPAERRSRGRYRSERLALQY
jgi:hypothetical protein